MQAELDTLNEVISDVHKKYPDCLYSAIVSQYHSLYPFIERPR